MEKHYEYALTDPADPNIIFVGGNWTEDYPAIRSARRAATRAGVESKILRKEVVEQQMHEDDPYYDVDTLVKELTPVLAALGYVDADGTGHDDERFDEVEKLALLLMPIFGESLAMGVVNHAQELYSDEEGDVPATVTYNDKKRDEYYDKASYIRHLSGVKSWSNASGAGLELDSLK